MNILFWNINGKSPEDCLQELLTENNVDLLILAEYPYNIDNLCTQVNAVSCVPYKAIPCISGRTRIQGIINIKYDVELLTEVNHYRLVKITATGYELIVAMIHARSKRHSNSDTQKLGLTYFYNDIVAHEDAQNINNTIAIGDFNVSPFENACINASGMHAIPFPDAVENDNREVMGKMYRKFYNPTWKLFGNRSAPYTTYYYDNSGEDCNFYWYAFDQVIIRPALMEAFDEESLRIITGTKNHNLLKVSKTPDKMNYSDHLPLFCSLKEGLI